MTNADDFTPTESLILDVLTARWRLGDDLWTFESRLRPQARRLAARGLVELNSGIVEKSIRLSLTDAGLRTLGAEAFALGVSQYLLEGARSPWAPKIARLRELAAMEAGWLDGAGAALDPRAVHVAHLILLRLAANGAEVEHGVFPTEEGGVNIESPKLHGAPRGLFAEVLPDGADIELFSLDPRFDLTTGHVAGAAVFLDRAHPRREVVVEGLRAGAGGL